MTDESRETHDDPTIAVDPGAARRELESASTLHWFHWAIVGLSLLITYLAWSFSKSEHDARVRLQFDREADQAVALVRERIQKYEDALWGGVAFIGASGGDVDFETWRTYADGIDLARKYPGINGIGVIHHVSEPELDAYLAEQREQRPEYEIHPPHDEPEYFPISYIVPVVGNEKAVGLDMAHESNRYTAAQRARDTGTSQMTGPITLVQDAKRTPGFLFYAPFYEDAPHGDVIERRRHFSGLVYAPFVVNRLMAGTLEKERRQVGIRLTDGDEVLYDEHVPAEGDFDPAPMFRQSVDVALHGRTWTFDIWSTRSFRENATDSQPIVILVGALLIDGLLIYLFISISQSSRRALRYADAMTRQLETNAAVLEQSNAELLRSNKDLDEFAYAASHDLRSPLRGIDNLVQWIDDDAGDVVPDESKRHLEMVRTQIRRMDRLLSDLLDYSRVGRRDGTVTEIDTAAIVRRAVDLVSPPGGFEVEIDGSLPTVRMSEAPVLQVFQNLIGNSVAHHDQPAGRVVVSGRIVGEFAEFTVTDDGPGIPAEFHTQVFGMFRRLKSHDEMEGTGLGLAIVKKVVERNGGQIAVESEGRGTTFRFTLRREPLDEPPAE